MVSMDIKENYSAMSGHNCPTIYLNGEQTEALGITGLPAPGTVYMLKVRAVVCRMSAEAESPDEVAKEGNQPDVNLTLDCTDMEVVSGGKDSASLLYGA